jgi:hypothetical protein
MRAYHQYRPPDVGIAEPSSAIATPTMNMNIDAKNQPQTMPTGPAGMENASVEAIEGSRPMILNAIPKISIKVKFRRSSCLYPSLAISLCQHNSMNWMLRVAYPEVVRPHRRQATLVGEHLNESFCL